MNYFLQELKRIFARKDGARPNGLFMGGGAVYCNKIINNELR